MKIFILSIGALFVFVGHINFLEGQQKCTIVSGIEICEIDPTASGIGIDTP